MPDKDKHFADNAGILKKIKSVLGLNIGTMLFGALFLYMLFSVVLYLTSSNIESYLVIAGPLSRNETYTGLAIRTEKVYKAETGGYVSYYAREGSKINANGVEQEMVSIACKAIDDKKALDIKVIDIREVSVIADYFVITSGSNLNQVQAIVDNVEEQLGRAGFEPKQIEGTRNSNWILMDYGDLIIHVFDEENRLFYDLERIWRDGKELDVSEFLK